MFEYEINWWLNDFWPLFLKFLTQPIQLEVWHIFFLFFICFIFRLINVDFLNKNFERKKNHRGIE
jgi:hypothetical protein